MGRPVVVHALHHYCFALRSVVLAWLISSAEDPLAPMGRKRNEGGGSDRIGLVNTPCLVLYGVHFSLWGYPDEASQAPSTAFL